MHKVTGGVERRVIVDELRAPASVEEGGLVSALLYKEDIQDLAPGDRAWFFGVPSPAEGIEIRLAARAPQAWDSATMKVGFELVSGAERSKPGDVGWVSLGTRPRERLLVPSSAVLNSPEGPYVLVVSPDRSFRARGIELGRVSRGFATVLSGLDERETIIVGSAFSWDVERRLLTRRARPAGMSMVSR
jgi:hypothetical protein